MEGSVARMVIDPAFTVGEVDERVFGSFVEHMGRAVYGGIYEPGHPTADEDGFRGDVLELTRELGRHARALPGRQLRLRLRLGGRRRAARAAPDPAGPRVALDRAQRGRHRRVHGAGRARPASSRCSRSTSARAASTPRATSSSTATRPPAAATPTGARANGHADPYGIRLWCLGNEMDGPWQIGQKTAVEYGRLAAEAGKAMRLVDPSIELVRRRQLELGHADLRRLGGHGARPRVGRAPTTSRCTRTTTRPTTPDLDAYLACSLDLDRMIGTVVATADAVAGRKRSRKRLGLSVDEWNVWHQRANPHHTDVTGPFKHAPPLAEDDHTVADALVVGCLLITLLRHADRVKVGCLAQLVNVIPPMRTLDGGPAWRQTSFFPFMHAARCGRGTVLRIEPDGADLRRRRRGRGAGAGGHGGARRRRRRAHAVRGQPRGRRRCALDARAARPRRRRAGRAPRAGRRRPRRDEHRRARPTASRRRRGSGAAVDGGRLRAELPPRSWNVLRLSGGALGAAA